MPAATSKGELLSVSRKEYDKLDELLSRVDSGVALVKDDDYTSIKDMVAHRSHWIGLFLGWYTDGAAGRDVFFPAEGYKWSDLKRYNADLRAQQADLGWLDARAALDASNLGLNDFIEARSEDELYGGPMAGVNNNWTAGRWAEAAGPSHFRSAAKYVRARLRS